MNIENARGFKGDKDIVKIERVKDDKGNLVEYQYNKDGICLVASVIEWSKQYEY